MALEREIVTYREALEALISAGKEGQFALIHEDQVAGAYPTFKEALEAGYEIFELSPFLVKRIEAVEEIKVFNRHIRPCPT
jgi:hypothetical protein